MRKILRPLVATCGIFLLFQTFALAQKEDFSENLGFFLEKAQHYQRWLDTTGLGEALRVEKVQFQKNRQTGAVNFKELELFLLLRSTDADSAASLWNQAQKDFEKAAGHSLKEELFRVFVHKMEIPAAQGNIQIYVNGPNNQRIPCFFVWVWDKNGYIQDSLRVNACKAHPFEIEMPPIKVKKVSRGKTDYVARSRPAKEVFDIIWTYANQLYPRNKYAGSTCDGRYPSILLESQTETELIFSVSDLCREALTNADLSIWCEIAKATGWQSDCNDIKREKLTFTFRYKENGDGGYRLKCELLGKFGSGVYMPRTTGYMDMSPDLSSFERDYAIGFRNALTNRLR